MANCASDSSSPACPTRYPEIPNQRSVMHPPLLRPGTGIRTHAQEEQRGKHGQRDGTKHASDRPQRSLRRSQIFFDGRLRRFFTVNEIPQPVPVLAGIFATRWVDVQYDFSPAEAADQIPVRQ